MITVQVQGCVPSQLVHVPVSHWRPKQHGLLGAHAWPAAEQVAPASQTPVVLPPGMRQPRPEQQSAAEVQMLPWGWQACGAWQTPPLQMPEQHAAPLAHACPLGAHSGPPSTLPVPPSGPDVPPSAPPPGALSGRHAQVSSPTALHEVPAQHVELSGLHAVPTGSHVGAGWQVKPPSPGRQRFPLQHWSLNWHVLPWAMQQPSSPV